MKITVNEPKKDMIMSSLLKVGDTFFDPISKEYLLLCCYDNGSGATYELNLERNIFHSVIDRYVLKVDVEVKINA
jgi:hypothetical protein